MCSHEKLSHEHAVNTPNISTYLGRDSMTGTNDGLLFFPRINNFPSHWRNLDSDSRAHGRLQRNRILGHLSLDGYRIAGSDLKCFVILEAVKMAKA
jgi:hypothetical protein